jgi:hypothetical protein
MVREDHFPGARTDDRVERAVRMARSPADRDRLADRSRHALDHGGRELTLRPRFARMPDIFPAAAHALGGGPPQCLHEDGNEEIAAGRAAGISFI